MDGRGPWDLAGSIREHQKLMAWYGQRNIPVEANEAHHWGMRDAPDVIFVVSAYLAAYNAKAAGVKDHIVQMMFNSPPGTSDAMDLAKMLAVMELVSELVAPDFCVWKQTRTGLLSFPVDLDKARAHLAASIYVQMGVKPDIVHVVGYPEADHAVSAKEVIESASMARRAIENAYRGQIDLTTSPNVRKQVKRLVSDARRTLEAIHSLGNGKSDDPLADADVLAQAVRIGFMDAPQLVNNPYGKGEISTTIDQRGACIAIDKDSGKSVSEKKRIMKILDRSSEWVQK
jgi:hypothetical protein